MAFNRHQLHIFRDYKNCFLITTSSYNQYFVDRTELETALDKFKNL